MITTDESKSLGIYMKQISRTPIPSLADRRALATAAKEGDEQARESLVACNLKLVVSIAMRYQGRGVDLADLIAEGNHGLLVAIERHDPERGELTTVAGCVYTT